MLTPHDLTLRTPAPRKQLAVLYGRLSRGDQSLDAQNRRMKKYAEGREFISAAEIEDDDTTGDTYKLPIIERTGGAQVIALLQTGRVGHLIVPTVDRIARSARGFLEFYDLLKQHDVTLHIADFSGDSLSLSGFQGKMFLTMMALFAEWELETIRSRVTKGMADRRRQSQLTGNIPYGRDLIYIFADGHQHRISDGRPLFWGGKRGRGNNRSNPDWNGTDQPAEDAAVKLMAAHGSPIEKRLVENSVEVVWLRRMTEWWTSERPQPTLTEIARRLTAHGVTTKQGRPWQAGSVQSVLTSRTTQEILGSEPTAQAA